MSPMELCWYLRGKGECEMSDTYHVIQALTSMDYDSFDSLVRRAENQGLLRIRVKAGKVVISPC